MRQTNRSMVIITRKIAQVYGLWSEKWTKFSSIQFTQCLCVILFVLICSGKKTSIKAFIYISLAKEAKKERPKSWKVSKISHEYKELFRKKPFTYFDIWGIIAAFSQHFLSVFSAFSHVRAKYQRIKASYC